MRVTKIIKEYVEKRVKEIYAPKVKAISSEYYAEKKEIQQRIDNIVTKANADINAILEDTGFTVRYGDNVISGCKDICKENIEDFIKTETKLLNFEIYNKISEIIVTLELGGTKAELEEMLKNLI